MGKSKELLFCDFGHTSVRVARMPIGGGAGLFLCAYHWRAEAKGRAVGRFKDAAKTQGTWYVADRETVLKEEK